MSVGAADWHRRRRPARACNPLLLGLFVTIGLFALLTLLSIMLTPAQEPAAQWSRQHGQPCLDHLRDCASLASRGECELHSDFHSSHGECGNGPSPRCAVV